MLIVAGHTHISARRERAQRHATLDALIDDIAVDDDDIPICECDTRCPDWEIAVTRGGSTYPLCEMCETQVMWDAVAQEGR